MRRNERWCWQSVSKKHPVSCQLQREHSDEPCLLFFSTMFHPSFPANSRPFFPGQPPQRPPSLGPASLHSHLPNPNSLNPSQQSHPNALQGGFRAGPYASHPTNYAMPPRNNMNVNVGLAGGALGGGGLGSAGLGGMPGYPGSMGAGAGGMGMRPQPSPGFPQQRGAGQAFPFNTGLGQQQTHGLHQQQQSNQQQHGGNPGLPPHLQGPTAQNPNINASNAASSGAASDVGLDPSDFPALGSTPASVHASALNSGLATPGTANGSYASQAGTTPGSGVQGGQGQTNGRERDQGRDFGPDDFPALGGGQSTQQQQQVQQAGQQDHSHPHPPGLNGVHTVERQNSLGMGGQQQQPGLLNLGPGGRGQQALQSESEKQRVCFSSLFFLLLCVPNQLFIPSIHTPLDFFLLRSFVSSLLHHIFLSRDLRIAPCFSSNYDTQLRPRL